MFIHKSYACLIIVLMSFSSALFCIAPTAPNAKVKKDTKMALNFVTSNHNLAFGKDYLVKAGVTDADYNGWLAAITDFLKDADVASRTVILEESNNLKNNIDNLSKYYQAALITRDPSVIKKYVTQSEDVINRITSSLGRLNNLNAAKGSDINTINQFLTVTFEKLKKDALRFTEELRNKMGSQRYGPDNIFVSTFSDKNFSDRDNKIEKLVKTLKGDSQAKVKEVLKAQNALLKGSLAVLKKQFNSWFQQGVIVVPAVVQEEDKKTLSSYRQMARDSISALGGIKSLTKKDLEDIRLFLENSFRQIETNIDQLLVAIRTA